MQANTGGKPENEGVLGLFYALLAFFIWGMSVVYWKQISFVPAFETLMHRMIWSFVFLMPVVVLSGSWDEFVSALKNRRKRLTLFLTTVIVSSNWFVFIWAINSDHVLQASLGYYINPLVNVFLGMVFLKEKLRRLQAFAVMLAAAGVIYLTVSYGRFPWVSIWLAFSFGFYGLIRKTVDVSALAGLSIETLVLSVPAAGYLAWIEYHGSASFLHVGLKTDMFLAGTSLVTALPLLLFTLGARRLNFSTIGFIQYLAPTCTFLLAVFVYNEPLVAVQLKAFVMIWAALALYLMDSVMHLKADGEHNT